MTRFLLDTDHLSLQQRGHPHLAKRLAEHPSEEVATSVITMEEMVRGRLAILSRRSEGEARISAYRRFQDTVHLFCTVQTVAFDAFSEQRLPELLTPRLPSSRILTSLPTCETMDPSDRPGLSDRSHGGPRGPQRPPPALALFFSLPTRTSWWTKDSTPESSSHTPTATVG